MLDTLLAFFESKGVSLQITLEANRKPCVHVIMLGDWGKYEVVSTTGETLIEALENMQELLFGDTY